MYEPLPEAPDPHRALRLLGRALRLRCPSCGKARLNATWFRVHRGCPNCGLRTERGEHGYLVGTYMFNLVASELVFAAALVGTLVATWPDPPWDLLQVAAPLFMIALPVLFYPFSRNVFLAFDLIFRPERPEDYPNAAPAGRGSR